MKNYSKTKTETIFQVRRVDLPLKSNYIKLYSKLKNDTNPHPYIMVTWNIYHFSSRSAPGTRNQPQNRRQFRLDWQALRAHRRNRHSVRRDDRFWHVQAAAYCDFARTRLDETSPASGEPFFRRKLHFTSIFVNKIVSDWSTAQSCWQFVQGKS